MSYRSSPGVSQSGYEFPKCAADVTAAGCAVLLRGERGRPRSGSRKRLTFRAFPSRSRTSISTSPGIPGHNPLFSVRHPRDPFSRWGWGRSFETMSQPHGHPRFVPGAFWRILVNGNGRFQGWPEPLLSFSPSETLTKQPRTGTCRTAASITRGGRSVSLDVEKQWVGFTSADDPVLA